MLSIPALQRRSGPPVVAIAVIASLLAILLGLLATVSTLIPFIVLGGLTLVGIAIVRPVDVICLGVLAVPLEGFFGGTLIGPSQAVLGAASVGWLIRWATLRPITLPSHPALAAFAVLVIANAAGLIFAPEPLIVARQVTTWGTMLIVAVAIAHAEGDRAVVRVLLAFAITGGLAGVVAVIDPRPLTAVVFEGGDVTRATGGLGSPNALGMLLVLTIPVQIAFAMAGTKTTRLIGLIALGLAMLAMTLSVSRGAFIGLGVAMAVLAMWGPFRRTLLVAVPIVLVLAFVGHNPASSFFGGGAVLERLTEVKSTGSENPRLVLWRAAPRMVEDRPLFGMGGLEYGHYAASYDVVLTEGTPNHAHNLLLTVLIETGVVGLGGLLALFAAVGFGLRRVVRLVPERTLTAALAYALGASFAGFLANGMFDYALGAAPIAAVFFVATGCAVALSNNAARVPATSPAVDRLRARAGHPPLRPQPARRSI